MVGDTIKEDHDVLTKPNGLINEVLYPRDWKYATIAIIDYVGKSIIYS